MPDGVPPARAVLAANMETALNAVWDARPGLPTALPWSGQAWSARWWRGYAGDCRARR